MPLDFPMDQQDDFLALAESYIQLEGFSIGI
jgi:hypothetical protein